MPSKSARNIGCSVGAGVLLSMIFYYAIHVFGKWQVENYRPDPETTASVLLHNQCAIVKNNHTLRPAAGTGPVGEGISGMKLAAAFMIFFDGHIMDMIILAVAMGGLIFLLQRTKPAVS